MEESDEAGRFLVASRDIQKGEVLATLNFDGGGDDYPLCYHQYCHRHDNDHRWFCQTSPWSPDQYTLGPALFVSSASGDDVDCYDDGNHH